MNHTEGEIKRLAVTADRAVTKRHLATLPRSSRYSRTLQVGVLLAGLILAATACSSTTSSSTTSSSPPSSSPASSSPSSASGSLASMVPASIKSAGQIVFGSPETNPPELYLNSSQQLTGIDYALGAAIAQMFGVKAVWVNTPFDSLIPAIDAGRIDVVLNSMDDTVAREAQLRFVDYEKDGALLLVAKGDPAGVTTVGSLCGKSVSLLSGSYQITLVNEQDAKCTAAGKPKITAQQYESVGDAVLAVQSGRDDAFFSSLGGAIYHQVQAPSTFEVPPNTVVYAPGPIGAAVIKGDTQLATALQKAFQMMFSDGTYQKILKEFNYSQGGFTSSAQFLINGGNTFNLNGTEPLSS
jgi:polar amino acid transport system substrate-binding protein